MARIRSIKPDFFTDEELATLPPLYRIAFEGLWCYADKKGRLEDKPGRLKHQILPYDDILFEDVLQSLHRCRFIQRYRGGDQKAYIQIRTFEKHQRPRVDEPSSQIPDPPEFIAAETNQSLSSDCATSAQSLGKERKGTEYVLGKEEERNGVPPARAHAATIVQRRRKDAAWEGPRVYVPQRVHSDFIGFRNHPGAERELEDWYAVVSDDWTTGAHRDTPIDPNMLLFWKARYAEQWPSATQTRAAAANPERDTPPPASWRDECAELHDPPCQHATHHALRLEVAKTCDHPGVCQSFGEHALRVTEHVDV